MPEQNPEQDTTSPPAGARPPRDFVVGPGPVFLRWTPASAEEYPELVSEVAQFDAGERDAGRQAARWLRERSLLVPAESVARLLLDKGHILGFYALASGSAELTVSQRRELGGSDRRTQPATILTQIARDRRSAGGTGAQLLEHAFAVARRGAVEIAATLLALDPHDADTMDMWVTHYAFQQSAGPAAGASESRLWIGLRTR
jgi:hypothetical protein